jgi:hypothetical protein
VISKSKILTERKTDEKSGERRRGREKWQTNVSCPLHAVFGLINFYASWSSPGLFTINVWEGWHKRFPMHRRESQLRFMYT